MASATLSQTYVTRPKKCQLLIAGQRYDLSDTGLSGLGPKHQRALYQARQQYGYALCMCGPRPKHLVIRKLQDKFILAVWPDQGHLHDLNCVFYRDEDAHREAAPYRNPHVANRMGAQQPAHHAPARPQPHPSEPEARRGIHVQFNLDRKPLTVAHESRLHMGVTKPQREPEAPAQTITTKGLMQLLWNEASLTRWHPAWHRDWGRMRYELLQAAEHMSINGMDFTDRVFIPRPYREAQKEELNLEWARFVKHLSIGHDGVVKGGLIVGAVRKLVVLKNEGLKSETASVHLRHMQSPIGLTETVYEFAKNVFKNPLRRIQQQAAESTHANRPESWVDTQYPELMMLAHVEATSRGGIWARGVWMMQAHPQYFIPANNPDEVLLIDALVGRGYQFKRIINAETGLKRKGPEWMVQHVIGPDGKPVDRAALDITNHGGTPEYLAHRAGIAQRLAQQGIPTWTWTPTGSHHSKVVPQLPPHEHLGPRDAQPVLEALHQSPGVFYEYGHSRKPSTESN